MRLLSMLGPDLREALASDPGAVREALEEAHPEDVAELLEEIDLDTAVAAMRVMEETTGADVLERLGPERRGELMAALDRRESIPLLSEMAADDRVDLMQELPDALSDELLSHLDKEDPESAEEVRELQVYGEETAGGLMTPDFISLAPETKSWQAIDFLREVKEQIETIYYVYVLAYGDKLVGVVSLRELILSDKGQSLEDIMTQQIMRVAPADDQEKVAATIAKYDLMAIPVVDEHGVMRGVVTIDDVVDVVIEEATEDAHKMGGVVPLENSYFDTDFATFIWKRAAWLVVLFGGQLLTATVMESHESTLNAVLGLVVFIPLIIATGGNSGSQSSTLVIRAMAVGELEPADWVRVLGRELGIGLALGLVLGAVGFVRAAFVGVGASMHLAITVASSIVAVVTLGTLMGSLLPLGIRRIGLDPAVSSTPFIASLVDVVGLLVYFAIAQVVFGLALS